MYAHYFARKQEKFVIIARSGRLQDQVKTIPVSGKREAKKVARENNAVPWNF